MLTNSFPSKPYFLASCFVACTCLAAIIAAFLVIFPFGPITVISAAPSKSPEFLTGGFTPSANESVFDISTWVCSLSGPNILTLSIFPFAPSKVTCSLQAYCPGWDKSLFFVNL